MPRRRTGGRVSRIAKPKLAAYSGPPMRRTPVTQLLCEEDLNLLEQQADWILKEVGMEFRGDPEVLDLFRQAGLSVSGERVRFDTGEARKLCETAPSRVVMHGRDPSSSITVGDGSLSLTPGYGSPFVNDRDQGRRYATLRDFENFVKMSWMSPWIHHSGGTVCEPVDTPVNKRHLDMLYAHLRYSGKPFMGSVTAPERATDSIAMVELVYGEEYIREHCVIQANININSPLVLDSTMSGALKVYARASQCNFISPFILGGAMGPVTQAALIAQAHAETQAVIALTQLINPGSPVVYGNFLTTLDLKSGAPTFGAPEANLAIIALGQLCRRMNLPLRGIGHVTAAKVSDAQAMQESSDSMTAAIMAGSDIVFHAAGWLEGGLTMGYEKFVIDLDRCAMTCRSIKGLVIDQNQLAQEAYLQVSPGENFLSCDHTMANYASANYRSVVLANTQSWEQWQEAGSLDTEQRATAVWKQLLADYQPPAIDPGLDESLQDFIKQRKNAMPDRWH